MKNKEKYLYIIIAAICLGIGVLVYNNSINFKEKNISLGDVTCSSGTFLSNGKCVSCPAGSYCSGGKKIACPAGKGSIPNSTYPGDCTVCSVGYYSTGGSGCKKCPDGKTTKSTGSTKLSACISTGKKSNTMKVTTNQNKSIKYSTSSKNIKFSGATNTQGKVTYSIVSQKNSNGKLVENGATKINYFSITSKETPTIKANSKIPVGTYKIVVRVNDSGNVNYNAGTQDIIVNVVVKKATNPITVTANQSWKSAYETVAKSINFEAAKKAKGKVTYSIRSQKDSDGKAVSLFSISNSSNASLKKAAKAAVGTYKVIIRAKSAGNSSYNSGHKDITMKVTINKATTAETPATKKSNPISVTANQSWTTTYSSSARTIDFTGAKNAKGKVTYSIRSQKDSSGKTVNIFSIPSSSTASLSMTTKASAGTYTVVIRAKAAGNSTYKEGNKDITMNVTIKQSSVLDPLPQELQSGFKLYKSYDSNTLKYWIEHSTNAYKTHGSSNMYLTHIWVKDPANQISIAYGGGTTLGNNQPEALMKSEINAKSLNNKGLIAINSSFFGDSNIREWGTTQSTRVLINNGKILRDDCSKDFGSGKAIYSSYGITSSGKIKYYNTANKSNCAKSRDQMISDGVKYSSGAWGEIKKDNQNREGYSRNIICPMDNNNFILITAYNMSFYNAAKLGYEKLGCQTLINVDGGGSLTLLYKDNTSTLNRTIYCTTRSIADMLYFKEK